jgi:Hydrazine synthase alpha subunit middle domain
MRRSLWGVLLLLVAAIVSGQGLRSGSPSYIYTETPKYDAAAWIQGGDRFPDGAHLVLMAPGGRRDLLPGFFASADAAVSFDGSRVLFSGRKTRGSPWQIWETAVSGGTPRLVSANSDSCIRPLYLPYGKLAYTRSTAGGSTIEVLQPGDPKPDVLTHVPGRYLTDDVLRDGRILFEWLGDLYTVYPDGTGVESVRCDHGPRRSAARQVSSGDIVFGIAEGLARFTSALAFQQKLPPSGMEIAGPVSEAQPGRWLVSARPRSGGPYGIYAWNGGAGGMDRLLPPAKLNAVEPVVVAARVPPRDFPSALVPTRTTGNLMCLDVKESKDPIEGKVHSVRLYTLGAGGRSEALGQTEVASDGSFYVEVPADRPVRMELLDSAGGRLRGEEHWFWMRPSEQRICVGCHAGPERAPENKVPEILNQTLDPVKMLGESGRTQ